ncbi:uncharacterized protein LOC114539200 [Dendronephthya gigantea]|uniref:uncharacterized protein LOC114539200 n=1 Tax=Dendronephthya gigantea TaxID=151771 RepID=UPI00106C8E40|nr:uncharacterized protein LOC114539200 [Dendronephthya gigantea]
MDSLTWDKSIRQTEFQYVVRYLDHLCTVKNIPKKHMQLSHHVLKVPRQQIDSNSCGIYNALFLKHFLMDLDIYESNPNHYVNENHQWFTCEYAEEYRRQIKRQWDMQFLLHTKFGKS